MVNRDELEGKGEQLKGKVKQAAGDLTVDPQLRDEGAMDEAEESNHFDLASAIGQLTTRLDKLRPEYREDLQELNQMLEVLQNMMQTSHQMRMGAVQNMRP